MWGNLFASIYSTSPVTTAVFCSRKHLLAVIVCESVCVCVCVRVSIKQRVNVVVSL